MANVIPTIARADTYAKHSENIIEDVMSLRSEPWRDVVLLVGDGATVIDDLKRFYELGVEHDTMLINHVVILWQLRNRKFEHFLAGDAHRDLERGIAKSLDNGCLKHCWNAGCGEENGFDILWLKQDRRGWSGTTGNLGIKIAIALDYVRIVLAGMPMDESGHWYDKYVVDKDDEKLKSIHSNHLWFWTEIATRPIGRFIRSMSGNTKDLFDEPDYEWLTEVISND